MSATFSERCAESQMSVGAALEWLEHEFLDAIYQDPTHPISTPGYTGLGGYSAADVLLDKVSSDDAAMATMARLIVRSANAGDVEARAWIAAQARSHAEFHAEALCRECYE